MAQGNDEGKMTPAMKMLEGIKTHEFLYQKPEEEVHASFKLLNKMRCDGFCTDVTVQVEGEKLPCHKVVLALSSEYFRALFTHNDDRTITLPDVSLRGFQALLQYMYTNEFTIDLENIQDVLEAADFLQFRPVVQKCCSILLQHISISNCLDLHHLADAHTCGALADAALAHILRNFQEVCKTEGFLRLSKQCLMGYLQNKYLRVTDEAGLFKRLCDWTDFHFDTRKDALTDLLAHVDLPSIGRDMLPDNSMRSEEFQQLLKDILGENKVEDVGGSGHTQPVGVRMLEEVLVVVPTKVTREIRYFCARDNKWKTLTKLPFSGRRNYRVVVLENEIYVTGGEREKTYESVNEVWSYSVEADLWTKRPPMIKCRTGHSSAASGGRLYVAGYVEFKENRFSSEVFDPTTQQWTLLPRLTRVPGCGRHFLFVALDNKLYALQGYRIKRASSGDAFVYDIDKNYWHTIDVHAEGIEGTDSEFTDRLPYEGCVLLAKKDNGLAILNPVSGQLRPFLHTCDTHWESGFGGVIQGNTLYLTDCLSSTVYALDLIAPERTWRALPNLPKGRCEHLPVSVFKPIQIK